MNQKTAIYPKTKLPLKKSQQEILEIWERAKGIWKDKKIDPTKLRFGSKIKHTDNSKNAAREEFYTVKEILSINLIRLNNDLVVRLIGVKPKKNTIQNAKSYLEAKVLKKKIY